MRDFHLPGRSAVFAMNGMCATSHPMAARAAIDILRSGGNAADAAIAGAILLGIAEPQMAGLGGDCFALVKPAGEAPVLALNGSGRAPQGLDPAKLRSEGHVAMPAHAAAAVTIPGAVDAFCRLSAAHGRLGLDAVLAPAIEAAEAGIPVAPRVAFDWVEGAGNLGEAARRHFLKNGRPLPAGAVFAAPGQAEVLRRIARKGAEAFYGGEVAADMLGALISAGGTHTEADFASTQADWGSPISGTYKGIDLLEHPPNGHGATAILMANILAEFDLPALPPFGAARAHIEAEATKLAYDARNRFLADADHTTRLDHMLALKTARGLAALIDPARAMADPVALAENVHKETIYITVVDRDRMMVSLIYSIYDTFGSGIASPEFGILLHNRGAGFTLAAGHPNEAGGGKRPMHTIIPAMLAEGGRITMPFGVMGGAYQPAGHARVLTNLRDYGLHPQAALDAPRIFWDAGVLKVERGYDATVRAELAEMGHRVEIPRTPIGGAQAIRMNWDTGVLEGASDPRKDGCALGY